MYVTVQLIKVIKLHATYSKAIFIGMRSSLKYAQIHKICH